MTKPQPSEDLFTDPTYGHLLTRAIIDTIREPLVVLDEQLKVLVASPSFYTTFQTSPSETEGRFMYELGNGQWDLPELRNLLKGVVPDNVSMDAFEVEHVFPKLGRRIMVLSSKEIRYENGRRKSLVTIYDVTERRDLEAQREHLIKQKDLLLKEMRHRIANSLQLIASILLLKAGIVDSEETRKHLEDAHERIMSIATVQRQLDPGGLDEEIPIGPYLESLCVSLSRSMIGGRKPIQIKVNSDVGAVSSEVGISIGLLTTELVINSIKHAFPNDRTGTIVVTYTTNGDAWELSIADDGIGKAANNSNGRDGLGTSIVAALASQLHAKVHIDSSSKGTKVTFTHAALLAEVSSH